ncbi:STAS domain-containing protein [Streptomyces mirabilis]|uniref:STAS domain-containing protein n=1 Tax=Streptomyces mirabilis TaxID=68239 RepID=UPI00368CC979
MDGVPSVETTGAGLGVVAHLQGEMDYVSAPLFRERLGQVIARCDRFIVVELTGVSFCDSAGLNVLLGARRVAEASGVELVLACVSLPLSRILEMTGADQVLRVFDTVSDAEAALSG